MYDSSRIKLQRRPQTRVHQAHNAAMAMSCKRLALVTGARSQQHPRLVPMPQSSRKRPGPKRSPRMQAVDQLLQMDRRDKNAGHDGLGAGARECVARVAGHAHHSVVAMPYEGSWGDLQAASPCRGRGGPAQAAGGSLAWQRCPRRRAGWHQDRTGASGWGPIPQREDICQAHPTTPKRPKDQPDDNEQRAAESQVCRRCQEAGTSCLRQGANLARKDEAACSCRVRSAQSLHIARGDNVPAANDQRRGTCDAQKQKHQ